MDSALFGPIGPMANASGIAGFYISGASDKVAFIGHPWWSGTDNTKTISQVWMYLAGFAAGSPTSTFRISFQGVNAGANNPGRPDGVIAQSWTIDTGSISTGVIAAPSNSFSRSVNRGDTICVVFDYATYGSGTVMQIGAHGTVPNVPFPAVIRYNGSWTASPSTTPVIGFTFTDGTYGTMAGAFPVESSTASTFSSATSLTSALDSGDERGFKWVPTRSGFISGAEVGHILLSGLSDFDVAVYKDTTLLTSATVDSSAVGAYSTIGNYSVSFSSVASFSAGDNIYVTVKPTSSNTINFYSVQLMHEALVPVLTGGESVSWAQRADGGAWATNTGRERKLPLNMVLRGRYSAPSSISGTHTISGIATINGTPAASATVTCFRPSDGGSLTTTTNENGAYSFSVAGDHTYHVFIEKEAGGVKYNAKSLWSITPIAP